MPERVKAGLDPLESEQTVTEQQRIAAIQRAYPGASSDFLLEAAAGSESINQIQNRLIALNDRQIAQRDAELGQIKAEHQRLQAERQSKIGGRAAYRA